MGMHSITSPLPDSNVPAKCASGICRIDADGVADDLTGPTVAEVYGKVFATADELPHPGDPELQGKLQSLIDGGPDNGCIDGTVAGDHHYEFHYDNKMIPVHQLGTNRNYLETWVRFAGDDDYYLSNHFIQFTPLEAK